MLVSNSLFLYSIKCFADTAQSTEGKGMSYWDDRTSKKEACDKAELEAKNDVLRKLGLESLQSNQIEACTDSGDKANCELYQSTFNTISGGYIKTFKILEKGRGGNDNKFCVVKIVADAVKFEGKHDPNFIINANIGDRRRFFEGSNLVIDAELSKEAFVNVLGWYPDIDKNNYYKLYPNQFEKDNLLENKFNIPTRANSTKYKLNIGFPEELKKDETQEFIIVLATKRKFAILNQIKLSELLTRLDDEGKSNWYMQKIGYSVLRKK
ncbi:DUF4384 domain-containing protein [Alphaproteobacteria bacterium]|nr:DUF4384 domain-containing protein [Alphaproteobacteria bacterium]